MKGEHKVSKTQVQHSQDHLEKDKEEYDLAQVQYNRCYRNWNSPQHSKNYQQHAHEINHLRCVMIHTLVDSQVDCAL